MRGWAGLLLVGFGLSAQEPGPGGVIRGVLLERDGSPATGEISVRTRDNHVRCFLFDGRTAFEPGSVRTSIADLRPGDMVEIRAGVGLQPRIGYARSINVVGSRPYFPAMALDSGRLYRSVLDDWYPAGNLTFAGVVKQVNGEGLTLGLRTEGEKRVLLTPQTRYLQGGLPADIASLRVNMRIFIRAGQNLDGDVEAYQVIWGSILQPPR